MDEKILWTILIVHFFADFVLQTHEQATNKYKWGGHLIFHGLTYSLTWLAITPFYMTSIGAILVFIMVTFILHTVTDGITSNISKKFFDKKDFHNGFVVVGFDQILHYLQLYLTFKFLL